MSFDSDPFDGSLPSLPEMDKIDRDDRGGSGESTVIRLDYDLCEDSGVCSQVCPEDVFEYRNGNTQIVKADACTECWICVENCVSGALDIG